jgi:hypothetical protein
MATVQNFSDIVATKTFKIVINIEGSEENLSHSEDDRGLLKLRVVSLLQKPFLDIENRRPS